MFVVSCTTDETIKHPSITESEETVMRLTINTPPTTIPEIKSRTQTAEESEINEIRVLVFLNGKYTYSADGDISAQEDNSLTFTATLLSTSSPVTLFLIANANISIDNAGIEVGDTPSAVKDKILYSFTSDGITGLFPMYGEYNMPSISSSGNTISGIKMLRSIARADIFIDDEVTNFEMISVQLFRVNDNMQVIPNSVTKASVTSPSVPNGANESINTVALPVSGNESVSQLYFPESVAPNDDDRVTGATCIVVGGKYNNSSVVTYYRIDFNLGVDGYPFGQILRNHKYIFNILGVNVAGKNTPEEAANGQSMGIITEVQTWDENSTDMWYEGEQYFSVSSRTVYLRPWAGTFEQFADIKVNTDIPSYTIQWSDASGTPIEGSTLSGTAIANDNYRVELIGSNIRVEALTNNSGDDDRLAYFVIHAGRWDVLITISQYGLLKHSNDLIRVMSFTEIGDLGNGYSDAITDAAAIAMRQILNKQFSPGGVFKFGGYHFTEPGRIDNGTVLSPTVMSNFDVIFFPYNQQPSQTVANNIESWLKAKPNRVLIIGADASTTNIRLLDKMGDNLGWNYTTTGLGSSLSFQVNEQTRLFTQTGLFGSVSSTSIYGLPDGIWGRATQANDKVIPLLAASDGSMVLGVNMEKRIVYIGDSQLFYNYTNGLSGTAGAVSTDRDKLMANVWAWITETVLSGK